MERGGLLGTTRRWWPLCVTSRTSCSTSKRSTGYSTPARQPSLSSHLAFGRTRAQAARAFARATEVAEKHLPHRHPFRFAATSAPGLGSPLPHLRRDWARPCHICAGTGRTPCHIIRPFRSLPRLHPCTARAAQPRMACPFPANTAPRRTAAFSRPAVRSSLYVPSVAMPHASIRRPAAAPPASARMPVPPRTHASPRPASSRPASARAVHVRYA